MELNDDAFDFIDHLIAIGALELVGIDPDGEPRYLITQRCKEIYPDIYNEFMLDVGEFINKMWQLDMIDLRFTEEEILVRLNENTLNSEKLQELSEEDRTQLLLIIDQYVQKRYNDIMDSGDYDE